MPQPKNAEEYRERFHRNQRIEGFGTDTATHLPCPFCAASDFMTLPITQADEAMQRGAMCKECGRSAKGIVERSASGVRFEIVQTGGPDQPEWLEPKMRRVS